jgi:hypothetical protein
METFYLVAGLVGIAAAGIFAGYLAVKLGQRISSKVPMRSAGWFQLLDFLLVVAVAMLSAAPMSNINSLGLLGWALAWLCWDAAGFFLGLLFL